MATLRTNLYELDENGLAYTYRGPSNATVGSITCRYATYTGLMATADSLKIAGGFRENEKVLRISIVQSADGDTDNDLTFNLGFTGALTGMASASIGLQATTAVELDHSNLAAVAAAANSGDELILTVAAGEAEAAVTYRFFIESIIV